MNQQRSGGLSCDHLGTDSFCVPRRLSLGRAVPSGRAVARCRRPTAFGVVVCHGACVPVLRGPVLLHLLPSSVRVLSSENGCSRGASGCAGHVRLFSSEGQKSVWFWHVHRLAHRNVGVFVCHRCWRLASVVSSDDSTVQVHPSPLPPVFAEAGF